MAAFKCEGCSGRAACMHAFGRFYQAKSNGGVGCDYPAFKDYGTRKKKRITTAQMAERLARQTDLFTDGRGIENLW